jgi:uncharacterized membrane protein SirB2
MSFFVKEEGMSFWSNNLNIIHLHMLFAILFVISYTIKCTLFLINNKTAFLAYKKKTLVIETLFSVLFLVFGFWILIFWIRSGYPAEFHKWLDPKITLALIAIPVGIIGFKKEKKAMVAVSLFFFLVAFALGLTHYH